MNRARQLVAQRYARAFFNIFGKKITRDDFYNILILQKFSQENKRALFFLELVTINDTVKLKKLMDICDMVHLGSRFNPLLKLLVTDGRAFLFVDVMTQLSRIYKQSHNIFSFSITSSHPLDEKELALVKTFLVNKTGGDIIYKYNVDKSLIAGIRLQSETMIWEYSIRKQLNNVRLQFIR